MRKQANLKDQILEPLCSMGVVLASVVALFVILYIMTVIIRLIASVIV